MTVRCATSELCPNAKYLVLHFLAGRLISTKVSRSWRGAQMSKRNHDRFLGGRFDAHTRILPIETILALEGLERPDTDLNEKDMALLTRMGISDKDHSDSGQTVP
jgi:hypothetical protein